MDNPKITVSGNAEGGWHVEIHDGDNFGSYSPEAATADEASAKALAEHAAKFPPPAGAGTSLPDRIAVLEGAANEHDLSLDHHADRITALEAAFEEVRDRLKALFEPHAPLPAALVAKLADSMPVSARPLGASEPAEAPLVPVHAIGDAETVPAA